MPIQDEYAFKALPKRGTNDFFRYILQGGKAQAECAGIGQEVRAAAEVDGWGQQHAGLLGSGIRQGQRDFHIRKQRQVAVLFARPHHQYQAVVVLEIFLHIHPVQVFDAHITSLC